MSDAPPAWPPFYFSGGWFRLGSDEPQFRIKGKYEFEFLSTEEGDDPALAAPVYAEDLARHIAGKPKWLATGGWEIEPGPAGHTGAVHSTPFVARHPDSGRTIEGRLALSPDPSHWVKVEVYLGAFRVLVAYLDMPWEQHELWPSGAPEKTDEAPGRIGKRRDWTNFSAAAWPVLERFAEQGWFNVELPEG